MSQFAVILAAAGKSSRFGDPWKNKVYATLANRPLWMFAAEVFSRRSDVAQVILVISAEDKQLFNEKYAGNAALLGVEVVVGGAQRADSVRCGLQAVREEIPFIAVHDAARPCLADRWIDAVFSQARASGAAILATPCTSTLKRVDEQKQITQTLSRANVWLAQTPQVFRKSLLVQAYEAAADASAATDEASLVEALGHRVRVVEGSPLNVKVTTKSDLKFAELALKALPKSSPFPFS